MKYEICQLFEIKSVQIRIIIFLSKIKKIRRQVKIDILTLERLATAFAEILKESLIPLLLQVFNTFQ